YVEEIDLCWRLKQAGWRIVSLPELTVLHHAGQSTRQTPGPMRQQLFHSRRIFNRKHRGPLYRSSWELIIGLGRAPRRAKSER
ncbi:MAG: glycosyltransferase family 2 protein, partial [Chloroflexota bacterium]